MADPTKEAYNPYRFNAKRWDAQSGTYDMGIRDYSPGLNRFTSRDMYNGALSERADRCRQGDGVTNRPEKGGER
ncbi:RHS repeat-associated core domain-containing protein [Streptomyces niveus]